MINSISSPLKSLWHITVSLKTDPFMINTCDLSLNKNIKIAYYSIIKGVKQLSFQCYQDRDQNESKDQLASISK